MLIYRFSPTGWFWVVGAMFALSACTSFPVNRVNVVSASTGVVLENRIDDELSHFLYASAVGAAIHLPQSPWGENVDVLVVDVYAAASGRSCRELRIEHPGKATNALACQYGDDLWLKVRPVTRMFVAG